MGNQSRPVILVAYTGRDYKQSLNAVVERSKFPEVEYLVNNINIFILMTTALFCGCMSLAFVLWSKGDVTTW
jgi:hypothetical protein